MISADSSAAIDAVFIGGPGRAVAAQEGRARALLARKSERSAQQAVHEPFESDRNLEHLAAEFGGHAIDHAARHHGLADCRILAPSGAIREKIMDAHRQVVIGRQQAGTARDDAVPIVIGIARKRDIELVLQADQALHGVGRRRVHADAAIPIERHEAEGGIDGVVDDGQIQSIAIADGSPIMHARATQRIDAQIQLRAANDIEIDHLAQIGDILGHEIVRFGGGRMERVAEQHSLHAIQAVFKQLVGARSE